MNNGRPHVQEILDRLKAFQRRSVDYVFRRLYEDENGVDRFLLADEVGLGKTLVARGVIARAVERLWDSRARIDVVYICSNGDIARQNINRLKLEQQDQFAFASRLTLLPLHAGDLASRRLNFVSFTPGTSFELGSRAGIMQERSLLYCLLREAWDLHGAGPKNVLQGIAGTDGWRSHLRWFRSEYGPKIDPSLASAFVAEIAGTKRLRERFEDLCERFKRDRKYVPGEDRADRNQLIGELRRVLAHCCVKELEPDLVILDEFQRFRHLLQGADEVAQLAQELFNYKHTKVLLLSATPYKMYTMAHEIDGEDHYKDFLQTVSFLLGSEAEIGEFQEELRAYREAIYSADRQHLAQAKTAVENRLRRVMCRTERLGVSADRNGMLIEVPTPAAPFDPKDVMAFRIIDSVASGIGALDSIELWKSGAYLLNFMEDYDLKRKLKTALAQNDAKVKTILQRAAEELFSSRAIENYEDIDLGNARLRALMKPSIESGAWQLLWMPPALPYYEPGGPYAQTGIADFTKALVFSSWQIVPKVIAMLGSYQVERRMVQSGDPDVRYRDLRERHGPLLRFAIDDERLTGLPVLALLYPCITLAREVDPLRIARQLTTPGSVCPLDSLLTEARTIISRIMEPVMAQMNPVTGPVDERWYWAALLLLDRTIDQVREWLDCDGDQRWQRLGGDEETIFAQHVEHAREFFHRPYQLGPPPKDLTDVLAKVAIASPAVVALRSLGRRWPESLAPVQLLSAAAQVAMGFRTLFNLPETMLLLRGLNSVEPYWERVLDYCADGNLQAVLDEYVHVLVESMGLESAEATAVSEVAENIRGTVAIRTTALAYDEVVSDGQAAVSLQQQRMRCRYALRFGEGEPEEGGEPTREDQVRSAFNSPFRPFILASTSVGQEGLDFHFYSRAIYHWNLPSNPVDLEQREGRIHRYKGYVIRKNLAARYGLGGTVGACDPWDALFSLASADQGSKFSDVVPYWVFEGPWKIERHVPLFPLSREIARFEDLKHSLALYRLVFGQPRQEDLLGFLKTRISSEQSLEEMMAYRIDLSPPVGVSAGDASAIGP